MSVTFMCICFMCILCVFVINVILTVSACIMYNIVVLSMHHVCE